MIIVALAPIASHPLLACAALVREAVKDAAGSDPMFLSPELKQQALLELTAAATQLQALRLSVLASADILGDVADQANARDAASWLAGQTRRDETECRRDARVGRWLRDNPAVAAAVQAGIVNLTQVSVIMHALRELDRAIPCLDPAIRRQAVDHLVAAAGKHSPRELRILGRKLLEVIAPEVAEDYERRRLEDEDAQAERRTYSRGPGGGVLQHARGACLGGGVSGRSGRGPGVGPRADGAPCGPIANRSSRDHHLPWLNAATVSRGLGGFSTQIRLARLDAGERDIARGLANDLTKVRRGLVETFTGPTQSSILCVHGSAAGVRGVHGADGDTARTQSYRRDACSRGQAESSVRTFVVGGEPFRDPVPGSDHLVLARGWNLWCGSRNEPRVLISPSVRHRALQIRGRASVD